MTRLLGQSPAGLSATGDSDTRNYYDMIAARQELDLRPQLERLDALLIRSAGVDAGGMSFAFRPLWQLSATEQAGVALQKAQASAVYAGLNLWPSATTAALVRSQLLEDGVYPGAGAAFGVDSAPVADGANTTDPQWAQPTVADYSPDQLRDPDGRWMSEGGGSSSASTTNSPIAAKSAIAATTQGGAQSGHAAQPVAHKASLVVEVPGAMASTSPATTGPHAPDGTPIELAGLRGKERFRAAAALLGAATQLVRRLMGLSESEEYEPLETAHRPAPVEAPSSGQNHPTDRVRQAQAIDPRIRSDLEDDFINDDGSLKWPPNDGVSGVEITELLSPGMVVDKYGRADGRYLAPTGTPFEARSLPYDS